MLSQMRRDTFGSKSEKLDPDQRNLSFEDVEAALGMLAAASEAAEKALGARNAPPWPSERNKGHLPPHLPRIEQVIEPGSIPLPPAAAARCIGCPISHASNELVGFRKLNAIFEEGFISNPPVRQLLECR
ncbi:Transposase C of IS166 homeodomain-containing protein [[Luteovulum] sphaeroides subsp. megalophilum]|nr:Transposase C of IS166 homeodomain-containing protein [[Luteovulum] sphaeroides subsp. megalophilum]